MSKKKEYNDYSSFIMLGLIVVFGVMVDQLLNDVKQKNSLENDLRSLKRKLKSAETEERYEDAVILRDQINELQVRQNSADEWVDKMKSMK